MRFGRPVGAVNDDSASRTHFRRPACYRWIVTQADSADEVMDAAPNGGGGGLGSTPYADTNWAAAPPSGPGDVLCASRWWGYQLRVRSRGDPAPPALHSTTTRPPRLPGGHSCVARFFVRPRNFDFHHLIDSEPPAGSGHASARRLQSDAHSLALATHGREPRE